MSVHEEQKTKTRIDIDRKPYIIEGHERTGAQLRQIPKPPIADDFDLWLEERGDVEDKLVEPHEDVRLKEDAHFYSAPKTIKPGR